MRITDRLERSKIGNKRKELLYLGFTPPLRIRGVKFLDPFIDD